MVNLLPLLLAVMSGLASSGHCLGMCGPFVWMISAGAPGWRGKLLRPLLYSVGRLTTYVVLGAAVGTAGQRITHQAGVVILPALLGAVSGAVFLREGLALSGIWPHKPKRTDGRGCGMFWMLNMLRWVDGPAGPLLVGITTALLPCALLYGMLALAAGQGDVPSAAVTMLLFGLGTVPALLVVPWAGAIAAWYKPQRVRSLTGAALVVSGAVALLRSFPVLVATLGGVSLPAASCH